MAKVVVAMSGGVDSSVAALLLKKDGHEVIGVTMRLFCYEEPNALYSYVSTSAISDAKEVAQKIGIPHHVVNLEKEFEKEVINNFVEEYLKGNTPNPCIRCNRLIKFEHLIEKIKDYDADFLATGHYAKIIKGELFKGTDIFKDQSYFLYGINRQYLPKILFPVGGLKKSDVKIIAEINSLATVKKAESQEICFIPNNDYPGFLKKRLKDVEIKPGLIVNKEGKEVGIHKGLPFYTIGQRRGIEVSGTLPFYVVGTNIKENQLIVGSEKDLLSKEVNAVNLNWLSDIGSKFEASAKIRYQMPEKPGRGEILNDKVKFVFDEPVKAITKGQSIVFYKRDKVIGGGIIAD